METRLFSISKTTNVTNLTKVIQQNSYRVLQVTSKWKTLKQPVKAVEFWPTFGIHVDITLAIFVKSCKTTLSKKVYRSLLKHVTIHVYRAAHYEITAFWKYEKLVFFDGSFFKWKNGWHLELLMNRIFGQRFIIFKKMRYRGQVLLKWWAVEVATSFHWISPRST